MRTEEVEPTPGPDATDGNAGNRRPPLSWIAALLWAVISTAAAAFASLQVGSAAALITLFAIRPVRRHWLWALPLFLAGVAGICRLPLGVLDERVAPIRIEAASVQAAWSKLRSGRGLYGILISDQAAKRDGVVFETKVWMSKRAMTEKFATENKLRLHVGYCGDFLTTAFNAYPLVYLSDPRGAQDSKNRLEPPP